MTTPLAPRVGYWQVLASGEFRALFIARTISMVGTVLASLALAVVVFERTASPLLSSLTFALGFVPHLIGGTLLSGLADRIPPRPLMVACDMTRAVLFGAMAVPGTPVWMLLALLFAGGLISPLFSGAQSAILPDILGEGDGYVLARSLLRIMGQTSQIVSYGLGGVILLVVTPSTLLIIDAVTFVGSAILIRTLTQARPARLTAPRPAVRAEGLRALWADRQVRRLLAFQALIPAFSVVPEALAIPYLAGLGKPAGSAGLLLWALPAGTVLGDVLCAKLLGDARRRRLVLGFALVTPLAQIGFVLRPGIGVAATLLVVSGLGFAHTLGLDALLLDALPVRLRGQGLALASSLVMFTQGLGFAVAGAAAELISPATVIWVGAVIAVVVTVALRPMAVVGDPVPGL